VIRLLSMLMVGAALAGPAATASASSGVTRPDGPRIVTDNKDPDGLYRFAVDQDMNQPWMALTAPARLQRR